MSNHKMSPELKQKWIQSIKELPLHRTGGYTEVGSLFEDYNINPTCAACAIGKLYQIMRKDYPDVTTAYLDYCSTTDTLPSVSDFLLNQSFGGELLKNWSKIVKANDISAYDDITSGDDVATLDDKAKTKLIAIIEANF